jgi:prepilin signal peptidase PulO-like enzyme (type II secretory pathway)
LFIIASSLIVLSVYDLKHYILPDKILLPAIGIVAVYQLFVWFIQNWNLIQNSKLKIENFAPFANPLLTGILAASFFLAIFLISRGRAMGFGDVKLAFLMGIVLGWPNISVALFAAFLIGAVAGIILILLKKKGMKSEVPFGPFLITGIFVALFFGNQLVDFYLNFLVV